MKKFIWLIGVIIGFSSCGNESVNTPKPRAYPRIYYPQRGYVQAETGDCPYRFERPVYSRMEWDSTFFDEKAPNPCWFDLTFPDFNAKVHFSYFDVKDKNDLFRHINDAFKMAGKHSSKANYIDERILNKPGEVYGRIFEIDGPAASPLQLYLTDSTSHFLRGALYVRAKIHPDSLAPIYDFIKEDIAHVLNTFSWKKSL